MDWENAERTSWVIHGTPTLHPLVHIHAREHQLQMLLQIQRAWQSKTHILVYMNKTVSQYFSMQDSTLIGPTDVSLGKCLIAPSP